MRRRYLRNRARGNIVYPGLIAAWSAKGKSNDDADRAVLRDLTGNGHDITLNGFAFSEMSGYCGYNTNLDKWIISSSAKRLNYNIFEYKERGSLWNPREKQEIKSYKVKIQGINDKNSHVIVRLPASQSLDGIGFEMRAEKDGIYTIPNYQILQDSYAAISFSVNPFNNDIITIEFLPEYPDALVFDGVDDFGINENMPILKDYTVIIKRNFITGPAIGKSSYSAFIVEFIEHSATYSFGIRNNLVLSKGLICYQNKTNYNGKTIVFGELNDTNTLFIGSFNKKSYFAKGAFYSAYLFDRSLDEQEIKEFIRKYIDPEYLLPSEIPNPDCYYDFSLGSNDDENRDTIVDQSGNGNDATAYNFEWNEEGSGYKDGALYFDGIDDYISLDAFDSGFKTVFMLYEFFNRDTITYDQRNSGILKNFAISTVYNDVYTQNRNDGITFINGSINNNIISRDIFDKIHLVTVVNENSENTGKPIIGCAYNKIGFNSSMVLYKFLGFKEALTEEQIKAIIKKYNLLDGVDEIEVS